MNQRIVQSLTKLFGKHRIVFWYDAKQEMREEFADLDLPGVRKLEINNNEFGLKYRILRQERAQKFLLYHAGPQPADPDNWLLDVLLSQAEFHASQEGLWLEELGLSYSFASLVAEHGNFFRSARRMAALKAILRPEDPAGIIELKMLGVCAGAKPPSLDVILENLLAEQANVEDEESSADPDKFLLVQRCGLLPFLWSSIARQYGYSQQNPSILDFAVWLFKGALNKTLSGDAQAFLDRWAKIDDGFKILSQKYEKKLDIDADLEKRDLRELVDIDCFKGIDSNIARRLIIDVSNGSIGPQEVDAIISRRRQSLWYKDFEVLYGAISAAAHFLPGVATVNLEMETVTDAAERYVNSWFKLDQLYRLFAARARQSGYWSQLAELAERVDKLYVNKFLTPLANRFQEIVPERWRISGFTRQDDFFAVFVQPFLTKNKKVCVIISDALRYEVADELRQRVLEINRHSAELVPIAGLLPSYTQLGMAALLPHRSLAFDAADAAKILADGESTSGLENRDKILRKYGGIALRADDIIGKMDNDRVKEIIRDNKFCYIYHNRIDAEGDKIVSEDRTFEAVSAAVNELAILIRKLANNNANNLLVTSDHGFLFQLAQTQESEFASESASQNALVVSRRYILGHNLTAMPGFHLFNSASLCLSGDMDALIARGLTRLRVKGSGSRYVHGGATLQEVIVPVLKINVKRQDDIATVDVDILDSHIKSITTNQVAITFYQREAVNAKTRGRKLRAAFYAQNDELISNVRELIFDSQSSNPREREQLVNFTFTSAAASHRGEDIRLKLEEKDKNTNIYLPYGRPRHYPLRSAFEADF